MENLANSLTSTIEEIAKRAAGQEIADLKNRVRFLEERLKNATAPKDLLTEKEAAEMLRVHIQSLKRWRAEKPARIPFVRTEGGDIRYRVDAIESYLKSRERGSAKTSLRAA